MLQKSWEGPWKSEVPLAPEQNCDCRLDMCATAVPLRVLIVDDHEMVRESLRLAIEREEGITVVGEAGDGIEGVRSTLELRPDVVLMDVDMPGLNGIEACQQIRNADPDAKVLILTASSQRQSVIAALVAGAKGYVVKVASHDDLVRSIRAVGRGETILHPAVAEGIVEELTHLVTQVQPPGSAELTSREQDVLQLVSKGSTDREVASQLAVSESEAKDLVSTLLARVGANSRSELVGWASRRDATDEGARTESYTAQRRGPDGAPIPSPGSTLGRYRLIEQVGQGGMATVFKALDPELNREVAIKVLPSYRGDDPTYNRRFRTEAQSIAALDHPNIIQIHDFGQDEGFTFIVMSLLTGGTLQAKLGVPIPLNDALNIIEPIAEALEFAHDEGIIHRDVKPSNVLLDGSGKPLLSDFGLARALHGGGSITSADAVVGTPEYISPEQAMGNPADQRSDLYALGVMLYQMLVGATPFKADTPTETLMAHVHQPVPLPSGYDPDIDPRVEANLIKALAKDPSDRHESPTRLVEALRLAESDTDVNLAEIRSASERWKPLRGWIARRKRSR